MKSGFSLIISTFLWEDAFGEQFHDIPKRTFFTLARSNSTVEEGLSLESTSNEYSTWYPGTGSFGRHDLDLYLGLFSNPKAEGVTTNNPEVWYCRSYCIMFSV
jgi:hypothetical protein